MKDDQKKGYIFEIDLKYPEDLHDLHSDYPLAPENIFDIKELSKLTTTLYDKKKYILHYIKLRLYLSLSLKLEKIYRVIEFEQKDWLRPYIEFNTNLRTKTDNEFEKDYYKLMNNSVFDTDSLIVEISIDDFHTDVKNNKQLLNEFDFSDYPKNNKYGIPQINKKVPGKFKDELNGQIITEFVMK
ncbi:Hypothetical protein CINCED_3A000872 [Cinara cedri]|uniref:Uncharacterized protein n=1 Tax=Cinara cedri TaxID=506608 RepID=A0A5E4MUK6_9HEMI|nr:Hypothetical protein CINCED_3A000872 [Cinara cedri]